jgi:hypothetical protein
MWVKGNTRVTPNLFYTVSRNFTSTLLHKEEILFYKNTLLCHAALFYSTTIT